jgi:ABC-type transport system involved in multi-copper enzyme maturation permease subunit
VKADATTFFTGPLGATDKNARVLEEGNEVFFATTMPLNLHEGLTVGVKLPKGAIDLPSSNDQMWWWIKDRSNSILAGSALAIVLLYFLWHWVRVGRDPSRGVIVPRWDAPMGLSPALVNYVANRGFSNGGWTAFSASAINLAVKGHIVLEDVKEKLAMKLTDKIPDGALPSGEDVIYGTVAGAGTLRIDKANGRTLQTMGDKFRLLIDKEHTGKYYRYNLGIIIWGIILTVVAYLGVVFFGTFDDDMLGLLIVPAFIFVFVAVFSAVLIAIMKAAPATVMKVIAGFFLAMFWLAFTLIVIVSAMSLLQIAKSPDDIIALACCGGMILAAVVFVTFMGAATPLGRQLMDGIEGLRLYLTVAEKDRMNLAGAPEMSPQHFEKMLPYAVALGVEKPWAEHFQTWLDAAGVNQNYDYQPGWYAGR